MSESPGLNRQFSEAYNELMIPVLGAMDANEPGQARELLLAALRRLSFSAPDPQLRSLLELSIHYQLFIITLVFGPRSLLEQAFSEALERIDVEATHREAVVVRNRFLLQLLCIGDREGYIFLTAERLRELLFGIPQERRDHELWHSLSHWAFRHSDVEILRLALAGFSTEESSRLGDIQRHRLQLMLDIAQRQASVEGAMAYVERLQIMPMLRDFRHTLWPRLQDSGAANPQLALLYDTRLAELGLSDPDGPLALEPEPPGGV